MIESSIDRCSRPRRGGAGSQSERLCTMWLPLFAAVLGLFALRVLYCLPRAHSRHTPPTPRTTPARTLIVLGSGLRVRLLGASGALISVCRLIPGGHTAEMNTVFRFVDRRLYRPVLYVVADTDSTSQARVERVEVRLLL